MTCKRLLILLFVLTLSASVLLLAACGEQEPEPAACTSHIDSDGDGVCDNAGCGWEFNATYRVTVKDYYGNVPEVTTVVEVYDGGTDPIKMKRISSEGVAEFTLAKGNYTFKLDLGDEYAYDEELAVFTPEQTSVEIMITNLLGAEQTIYVPCTEHTSADGDDRCDYCGVTLPPVTTGRVAATAVNVTEGVSLVTLDGANRTYFIFTPTQTGVYRFKHLTEGDYDFGYYGIPQFVQSESSVEVTDGAFEVTVSGVGSQIVIGISSESESEAAILVERISGIAQELPYDDILIDSSEVKYDDDLTDRLVDINVLSEVTVVLNTEDGYYHYGSANGPLVLVKITTGGNSFLADFDFAPYATICETDRMSCYFYDGDGNVVKKESYNSLIDAYAELAGSRGVVPLNEKLANAIKNAGEHKGWWKRTGDGANYIFGSNNVNTDSAWLYACCYVSENAYGSASTPVTITPAEEADKTDLVVNIGAGKTVNIRVSDMSGVVTITNATGVTVNVGGTVHTADTNGEIEFTVAAGATFTVSAVEATELHFYCVKAV